MKILIAAEDRVLGPELTDFLEHYRLDETITINVLHAVEPPQIGFGVDLDLSERKLARAHEMVKAVVNDIRRIVPPGNVTGKVVESSPKDAILREAEAMGADLIIVGSHKRTTFGRLLMGSVSAPVIEAAPCSTLVLRERASAHQDSAR